MPDSDSFPPSSRRSGAQRQRQRRQLQKRVLGGVAVAAVVVLAALWFSDTLRIPTDGPSFAGGAISTKSPSKQPDTQPTEPTHRAINPLQPLRLWIGGDSLAGALGPSLGNMTAQTGVVQPQYDSRVGSGLISGDIDWPEHAQSQMDDLDPEVAVFMIGTNDANVYDDSQAAAYALKVEQMMRILVGDGREVYWVNAPVMRDEDLEANVKKVDEIQREVAAKIPEVTFVDAHTLFGDETGEYQSSLPDETGDDVLMRAGDGIHLTGAGGDHLARAIFLLLDNRWKITEQTVPGAAKKVLVTKGSNQVPGSSSGSSYSSNSSSNRSSGSNQSSNENQYSNTTSTTATTAPPVVETQATTSTSAATTPTTAASVPSP